MLGNHALGSHSTSQGTRPALQLGRVSSKRVVAPIKQSRCRSAVLASKQHSDSHQSFPSVSGGSTTCNRPARAVRRRVASRASNSVQASSASSASEAKSSLTPVLVAVAVASLGALLFGLHVAIVNGLQDAVSAELGFSANTGLRGAVSLCISLFASAVCVQWPKSVTPTCPCRWCPWFWLGPPLAVLQAVAWQMVWEGGSPSCSQPSP